jgi:hypothetical protein
VADVLELLMFDPLRAHRLGCGGAFQCLNPSHLIDGNRLDAGAAPFGRHSIGVAEILTFLRKALIVRSRQPPAHAMRLQAGIFFAAVY